MRYYDIGDAPACSSPVPTLPAMPRPRSPRYTRRKMNAIWRVDVTPRVAVLFRCPPCPSLSPRFAFMLLCRSSAAPPPCLHARREAR